MADGKKYYCFCSSNCKYETMTKEQILAAIAQAVATGSVGDCDTGFITKVKEQNSGGYVTFWVGTQAEYNAITEKANNCMYIIKDDTGTADIRTAFEAAVAAAEDSARVAGELAVAAMPIDITDKLTFTLGSYNPAGVKEFKVEYTFTKFVYSPATKTVFFNFRFNIQGGLSAGDVFSIVLGGSYLPSTELQFMHYSLSNDSEKSRAALLLTGGPAFMLYALEDMSHFEGSNLTGWYFCNGEGV